MIRLCTFEAYRLQKLRKSLISDTETLSETIQGFPNWEYFMLLVFYMKQLGLGNINILIKKQ